MNILFVNMPIEFNKKENLEPPLGICYIASYLREKMPKHGLFLKDYEVEFFSENGLRKFLMDNRINVIGVSFRTASYGSAKKFIETAKNIDSRILIVGGGHHITAFPLKTIKDMPCDIAVKGEGEYVFSEIIERIESSESLKGLEGITFKENGEIFDMPERKPIENIDELPFPARDLLPVEKYNLMTILTSRGCPFKCIYCDKGVSTRKVKFRSVENILDEIRYIVEKLKRHKLYIVDDHFFLRKEKISAILDRIIGSNIKIRWISQARADGIDEDILIKAKKSGCEQIMYGLETGDEEELKYIRKETTLEQATKAIELTKKVKIKARANFMLGFPVSTHKTIRNTIRFAERLKPDIVRFFAVSPLPNTELWERIYGNSYKENIRWEELDFYNPSFETRELSRRDISLYVLAGYWHVLKGRFLLEATILFIPKAVGLILKSIAVRRLRGNISVYFPTIVNLIKEAGLVLHGKGLRKSAGLIMEAMRLERRI